jgi:hypothetical protein
MTAIKRAQLEPANLITNIKKEGTKTIEYEIIHLPNEKWKGTIIPIKYTTDKYYITTAAGKNFDAFMGIELAEGSMKGIKGKFYESEIFENLPKEEVEEYNKKFPKLQKLRFPGQWD